MLDPFNPKEIAADKLSILDIKARDQSGRLFNVEMQLLAIQSFPQRILYYGTRLHQQQLHEGHDYGELKPTISISFLNYTLFPDVPADYHLRFRLLEERKHFPLTDNLEFHLLELQKFTKATDELTSDLDIWLYFLRHAATMDTDALPAALQQHPLVPRAVKELTMITQSDIERERYEARRKAQLDHNTGLKEAQQKGEKIGMIHLCERLLSLPQTPAEQLTSLTLDDLTRLADELEARLVKSR